MNKKKIINDAIFKEILKDRIYDVVIDILKLLSGSEKDVRAAAILNFHDGAFSTLIFRFAEAYKYWYIKKDLQVGDDSVYFKFSNVVMYESDNWAMSEKEKELTKSIVKIFVKSGIAKKRVNKISKDRTATFYSIDFYRIFNYLMYLHENSSKLDDAHKHLKKKLIDGSIT